MRRSVILLAALLAVPCFAEDFFNVNFKDAEVDKAPPAQARHRGETSTTISRMQELEPGFIKVVEKATELTDKPVLFNVGDSSSAKSEIVLDGGNNMVTDGVLKIDFDVEPVSYKPASTGGYETVFTAFLTGNSGANIGIISFTINTATSTGGMNYYPAGGQAVKLGDFSLGKAVKFEIELDLSAGTSNIKVNGELKADKVKIPTEHAFRLLQFRGGRALGGRDGALTVALDNIRIYR